MTVLERIAAQVRRRIEEDRARDPEPRAASRTPGSLLAALRAPGTRVIAEVKLASPSEGDIAPGADPVEVASAYLAAGAAALSVLTERDAFKGSPDYLRRIRAAHPGAILLMKDFVVDEYQLGCALRDGADAVLLIVALLGERRTGELLRAAEARGLECLVEVHDEAELAAAGSIGARLIGVNNRNLKDLSVSLSTSERLSKLAPRGAVLVAESGLKTPEDIARLRACGFSGFLIGTHFMRSGAPGPALAALLKGAAS